MVQSQTDLIAFSRIREIVEKGLEHLFTVLSQVVLIFSIKPISRSISLKYFFSMRRTKAYLLEFAMYKTVVEHLQFLYLCTVRTKLGKLLPYDT